MNKYMKGFTLVEMMVTIAVLAIIIGIATPSFVEMMRQNTVRSQANELLALMHYARSEAIKRRSNVEVAISAGSGGNGWTASVNIPGTSPITGIRTLSNSTSSSVVASTSIIFEANGRRSATTNVSCIAISYSGIVRTIHIGISGSLAVKQTICPT